MGQRRELTARLNQMFPTATALRERFPQIQHLLQGEFNDKINIYEQRGNLVVSRPLIQGLPKDPTVGIISPGEYIFNTGDYTEEMLVLDGLLTASIDTTTRAKTSVLRKYGGILAPRGSALHLSANAPVIYLCRYAPTFLYAVASSVKP